MIITEEKYNEELTRCVLPFIRLNFEDGYMKSADGTRIHYGYVTTPVAKAAIVISHGFTECMPKYYEMIYYSQRPDTLYIWWSIADTAFRKEVYQI